MSATETPFADREITFEHMQDGDNPLTNAEIAKLAKKHPKTWTQFIGRGVDK